MTKRFKPNNLMIFAGLLILAIAIIFWAVRPSSPDFGIFAAGPERKEAFFNYMLPIIQHQNQQIIETRQQIWAWKQNKDSIDWWDAWLIQDLAEVYRLKNFEIENDADWNRLLRRVNTVPPSLALAQAATESAWGTSRFARDGNNYFGQWCFKKGCGIVPGRRDAHKIHEVAIFDSPESSVESYIRNLNSHEAYKPLRSIRAELTASLSPVTGMTLVDGLSKYSEQGDEYINKLRSVIRINDLAHHDTE